MAPDAAAPAAVAPAAPAAVASAAVAAVASAAVAAASVGAAAGAAGAAAASRGYGRVPPPPAWSQATRYNYAGEGLPLPRSEALRRPAIYARIGHPNP